MKLRILLSAVLVTALALPVIATTSRFPDVPADHEHAEAIRWASNPEEFNGAALFRGFPDGNFGPDQELTDGQFTKVVDRLFDSVDRWTRAETAALLYHGFKALREPHTIPTTTTTRPVVIEGEQPGGNGPGEETTTTTTTATTTTTQPTTTTTTIPPFPIQERINILYGKTAVIIARFERATHRQTGHTEALARDAKAAADDAVDYVTKLKEDYEAYPGTNPNRHSWIKRINNERDKVVKWQTKAELLIGWITTEQNQDTKYAAERKLTDDSTTLTIYQSYREAGKVPLQSSACSGLCESEVFEEDFETRIRNIKAVYDDIQSRPTYGDDVKRDLYKYVYYHTLWLDDKLDGYQISFTESSNRRQAELVQLGIQGYRQTAYNWLANDAF